MSYFYETPRARRRRRSPRTAAPRAPVTDPDPTSRRRRSPLARALHDADVATVRQLLAGGGAAADLAATDKLGQTPLVVAVRPPSATPSAPPRAPGGLLLLAARADANVADGPATRRSRSR